MYIVGFWVILLRHRSYPYGRCLEGWDSWSAERVNLEENFF
ncbi:hypothetical protein N44_04287 [Microcystis aeruginosa NIES-44]|uniref:Uncharacterized protein n=1 Tax=Microcystis aeruginosa NIES-44 TaxID=449439 RepID=A0A0A1W074_MICAE|nr:hypothetical protein N44_04287 [Microcystis aeruginosa NIES-44]